MKTIQKIRFFFLKNGVERANYLKNKKILKYMGENCLYQPYKIPMNPELVKMHSNVFIAANVTFITHDTSRNMLRNKYKKYYSMDLGCIEIMDNVFIGLGSIILPNVKINENVIVAAGSVVTKSIPSNSVVAGNPAKIIGTFEEFNNKKEILTQKIGNMEYKNLVDKCWEDFKKNQKPELKIKKGD